MLLIDARNAEDYLRRHGHVPDEEPVQVRELAGGVSNVVLLVSRQSGREWFVLKQVREQLRVPEPWYCSVERIWREVAVLQVCDRVLQAAPESERTVGTVTVSVPRVLFVDRDNYLFAMTAAPEHEVWKAQLLRGELVENTAVACGRLLGSIHAATWQHLEVAEQLRDASFFDALRLDPYFRHVAQRHSDVAAALQQLMESLSAHPRCLVHGDYSPKNILVHRGGLTLVDFEVGHFGDPAFDLGFFLSHLLLKSIRAGHDGDQVLRLTEAFWQGYERCVRPAAGDREYAALVARGIQNLAGCLLARVDGKSRVDYLEPPGQDAARRLARSLFSEIPQSWPPVLDEFHRSVVVQES